MTDSASDKFESKKRRFKQLSHAGRGLQEDDELHSFMGLMRLTYR